MMNCKGFGRKRLLHYLRYYAGIRLRGLGKSQNLSAQLVTVPRFEPGTSQIRRNANHSSTTFGEKWCEKHWCPILTTDIVQVK
jgi:hypothetical protein